MAKLLFWWLGVMVSAGGMKGDEKVRLQYLEKIREALKPIHRKLGPPGPHDWLAHHHEPGETFPPVLEGKSPKRQGKT